MKPQIFGVRHLSPAASFHLEAFLEEIQPTAVLIEGPSDMTELIRDITKINTKPPIAMLAYTRDLPVETILYPLADYSPEYRAMLWGANSGVHVEFIDLPSAISIQLKPKVQTEAEESGAEPVNIYEQIAELSDEYDYETYWERSYEQIRTLESFKAAMNTFAAELRLMEERPGGDTERLYHQIREAYMKQQIRRIIKEGHNPEKVVVITGAFHVPALLSDTTDEVDSDALPKREISFTLMPYSNYKLSFQSGYGAGNQAPAYFQMLWDCLKQGDQGRLPAYYLTKLVSQLRADGNSRSTAEVLEAARLASALAEFRSSTPTLKDLRDAATVCLGHGERSKIVDACTKVEIGSDIGELPDGVSQTPVQADFARQLKALKLEKYRTPSSTQIQLDLRENRRVKSREAALLDLHRSFFFHRLQVIGIQFAAPLAVHQEHASWAEHWNLHYNPEVEIQLVESTLLGETIELAAAYQLRERLHACQHIGEAAQLVRISYLCGMPDMMEQAREAVAALGADSGSFVETAEAIYELGRIIHFGDVRKLDCKPLIPLAGRLFLRGTLLLPGASTCDDVQAKLVMNGIRELNETAQELYEYVDEPLWIDTLTEIYLRDDLNPLLSGYCCGVLLEKNKLDSRLLEEEVARRLSPGIPADIGAGWFEGLSMSNKYALLSRSYLWGNMDQYISTLTDDEFRRALVFLRRSFSSFSEADRSKVAEILGGIWGFDGVQISEYLNDTLSEVEESLLDDLNEFDFGDM